MSSSCCCYWEFHGPFNSHSIIASLSFSISWLLFLILYQFYDGVSWPRFLSINFVWDALCVWVYIFTSGTFVAIMILSIISLAFCLALAPGTSTRYRWEIFILSSRSFNLSCFLPLDFLYFFQSIFLHLFFRFTNFLSNAPNLSFNLPLSLFLFQWLCPSFLEI